MKGIAACPGIGIGKAHIFIDAKYEINKLIVTDVKNEAIAFLEAREEARVQITNIAKNNDLSKEESQLLIAHEMMLMDDELKERILSEINEKQHCCQWAVGDVFDEYILMFDNMENEYMRERANDCKDIKHRLLNILMDVEHNNQENIPEGSIIVAKNLMPSHIINLKKKKIEGIVTSEGSATSHLAILAKTIGIPTVLGIKNILDHVNNATTLIVDGIIGEIIVAPNDKLIVEYREKKNNYEENIKQLKKLVGQESKTKSGKKIELLANLGSPEDIEFAIENDAEGVGLFRTEFMFMNRKTMPTEQDQFKAYKRVADAFIGKPVIIRTLDIGGDKNLSYLNIEQEMNPFLGYRAIRFCLGHSDIFKRQLRAILRANIHGNVHILFPMICTLDEIRAAKDLLQEAMDELKQSNMLPYEIIRIGIMIETPAAAIISDILAKEVDFFSIGTNDLVQYTMAADRMNPNVSYLYNPENIAVIRLIEMTIKNAHKEGIPVGICGEAGSYGSLVDKFIDLGVNEISMSADSILRVREIVRKHK